MFQLTQSKLQRLLGVTGFRKMRLFFYLIQIFLEYSRLHLYIRLIE